jgi:phage terminase large subunit-like protein
VAAGLPVEEYNRTQNNLTEATETLYSVLTTRGIRLYNTPDLRQHVLNAVSIETPRGIRLSKQKTSNKIDAALALSFAVLAAIQNGRPASLASSPIGRITVNQRFDVRRVSGHY